MYKIKKREEIEYYISQNNQNRIKVKKSKINTFDKMKENTIE